ncbi:MAG: hypothetical protein KC636_27245 [Myxococcales bacterium]|nr:hypothetical protein [Myxococcales bacterium]
MEHPQPLRGRWVSALGYVDRGHSLATALAEARVLPAALDMLIWSVVQVAVASVRCEHTGLALLDIWRYFRPPGFITLADDGSLVVSSADLDTDAREALSLDRPMHAIGIADGHRHHLP